MKLGLIFAYIAILDLRNDLSSKSEFRSANSLESLDFVTNSIQQARANSLSSATSTLRYFNGLNSEFVSSNQGDQTHSFILINLPTTY